MYTDRTIVQGLILAIGCFIASAATFMLIHADNTADNSQKVKDAAVASVLEQRSNATLISADWNNELYTEEGVEVKVNDAGSLVTCIVIKKDVACDDV